jgi:hypothetical protein
MVSDTKRKQVVNATGSNTAPQKPAHTHAGDEAKADRLMRLCLETGVDLFHDPDRFSWASVRVDQHNENHPIRSQDFKRFVLHTYFSRTGETPGPQAIRSAIEVFDARALFAGPECSVHLRVAGKEDKLYLDLCDRSWRAVEIDSEGWRVVDRPPVKFRRSRGSRELPEPQRGGSLDVLRRFFNIDGDGWTLVRAFLVSALWPAVPCPILVLTGGQGAGKSTACRIISSLIDPRTSALRGAPREVRDLVAAARNSWIVCFDNVSRLPDDFADAACRLATGGGFGGRELFSDHDEAVFDATRPLVFNSIPDLGAARPDFLDRALLVEFDNIKPEARLSEKQIWIDFELLRPKVLGALLDAVVGGLRNLPAVVVSENPRMADFGYFVTACEEGPGLGTGQFLQIYNANRADSRTRALESSPVFPPLRELAQTGFNGSIGELLVRLKGMVEDDLRRSKRWPKLPNALGTTLRRMEGNLRSAGIDLQFNRSDAQGRRMVSVRSANVVAKNSSAPSAEQVTASTSLDSQPKKASVPLATGDTDDVFLD